MSFSSSVFVPGASTEKLPFVHSHFKPRSTFAKSFGGCKRYSKHDSTREVRVTKLPQITYNATDQRTLATFGSTKRGLRREYPGFQGHTKISQRKTENRNQTNDKGDRGRKSSNLHKHASLPDLADKWGVTQRNDKVASTKRTDLEEDVTSSLGAPNFHHNSLDSLIFVDDDGDGCSTPTTLGPDKHTIEEQTDKKFKDLKLGISKAYLYSVDRNNNLNVSKGTSHTAGKHSGGSSTKVSFQDDSQQWSGDSLSVELEKRINDARGKSGMKRGRRKEAVHVRILGDVMTSSRLTELLLPRKEEASLKFT